MGNLTTPQASAPRLSILGLSRLQLLRQAFRQLYFFISRGGPGASRMPQAAQLRHDTQFNIAPWGDSTKVRNASLPQTGSQQRMAQLPEPCRSYQGRASEFKHFSLWSGFGLTIRNTIS